MEESLKCHPVTTSIIELGREMLLESGYNLPMKNTKKEQT